MNYINLYKLRYWPFIVEVYFKYDLTAQQAMIYSYLYNHCNRLNDKGYCGYSDEKIAKDLKLANSTFRRDLLVLKNKELIFIQNSGKRSKKAYQSRMIYLNTTIYAPEPLTQQTKSQDTEKDRKIAQLEAEIKRLKAEQLEKQMVYPSLYVQMLIDAKIIPSEDIAYACATLDDVYNAIKAGFNANKVLDHIKYITNQFKSKDFKKPDNIVKYLQKSAVNYYYRLTSDQKDAEKAKISQNSNNDTDDDEQLCLFDF